MKKAFALGISLALASAAFAVPKETNGHWVHEYPSKNASNRARPNNNALSYHGGEILAAAKVIPIFWGTYWNSGTGATDAQTVTAYLQQYGTNSHYKTITEYYDTTTGGTRFIGLSTLTQASDAWHDSTNPPTNVTDSAVQGEVNKYLSSHTWNDSTIYQVFIPPTSYSSDGTSTSCGGPHLQYCAYHGSYTSSGHAVKYAIEPYPSCSGCSTSGWTNMQNLQHFICHETREAVTDPVNAWWNGHSGYEADDQCAWTPTPFLDGGYGYQYEWSNKSNACIK
jgi:hypothetical protein